MPSLDVPFLGSLRGSCTVPGPGGSKELLAPAALGATWLTPCGSGGHQAGCQQPPAKARQEPAVPLGQVTGASGKQLGASPNPGLPFHSAFNFI